MRIRPWDRCCREFRVVAVEAAAAVKISCSQGLELTKLSPFIVIARRRSRIRSVRRVRLRVDSGMLAGLVGNEAPVLGGASWSTAVLLEASSYLERRHAAAHLLRHP